MKVSRMKGDRSGIKYRGSRNLQRHAVNTFSLARRTSVPSVFPTVLTGTTFATCSKGRWASMLPLARRLPFRSPNAKQGQRASSCKSHPPSIVQPETRSHVPQRVRSLAHRMRTERTACAQPEHSLQKGKEKTCPSHQRPPLPATQHVGTRCDPGSLEAPRPNTHSPPNNPNLTCLVYHAECTSDMMRSTQRDGDAPSPCAYLGSSFPSMIS